MTTHPKSTEERPAVCDRCHRCPASTSASAPSEIVDAVAAVGGCYHEWIGGLEMRAVVYVIGESWFIEARRAVITGDDWRQYDIAKARADVLDGLIQYRETPAMKTLRAVAAEIGRKI